MTHTITPGAPCAPCAGRGCRVCGGHGRAPRTDEAAYVVTYAPTLGTAMLRRHTLDEAVDLARYAEATQPRRGAPTVLLVGSNGQGIRVDLP